MLLTDEAIGIGVPASVVPSVGRPNPTHEHRCQSALSSVGMLRLSFSESCNPSRVYLASGTRDAKELGFDHVRPSEPYREQCLDKQEFRSSSGLTLCLRSMSKQLAVDVGFRSDRLA